MQTGKRLWALTCCMLMIFLPSARAAQPLESGTPMTLTTPSAILAETATGTVIFEKNADECREVASITKLMTALLKAISLLADNPYMGAALAEKFEIATDVRYFVVSKQLIFYRVDGENDTVEILRVLDGRTDCLSVLFG